MQKSWQGSKIEVYFDHPEEEKLIRRGFNNVIQDPSDGQVTAFTDVMNQLSDIPAVEVVVSESNVYVYA